DDREADSEAALCAIERAIALHEQLEHARQELRCESGPGVGYFDEGLCALGASHDADVPIRVGVLGGIREDVDHTLHEPGRIPVDVQRLVTADDRDVVVLVAKQWLDGLDPCAMTPESSRGRRLS